MKIKKLQLITKLNTNTNFYKAINYIYLFSSYYSTMYNKPNIDIYKLYSVFLSQTLYFCVK